MSSMQRWTGFWEQSHFGRQPMLDLELSFSDGRITGQGHDIVGPFRFHGTIGEGGAVALSKQYLGRHTVDYRGFFDGEGTIAGSWRLGEFDSGPFVLRLARQEQQPDD